MRLLHLCSIIVAVALACCAGSHAAVLYDGSTGDTPDEQNWFYNPGASDQANTSTFTTFDSTDPITDRAGYTSILHPLMPDMNRGVGFVVRFTVRIVSESHSIDHRAGFSVIVISEDLEGVELAFWEGEIWAQQDGDPLFQRDENESVPFDTTDSLTQYELSVLGDNYTLSAPGMTDLTGEVKNYTAFDYIAEGLPANPYAIPSFLFFGDDTSSAEAVVELSFIEVVPEPATAAVLLLGFATALARRKRPAA